MSNHVASAEHGIITLNRVNDSVKVGDKFDFVVGYTEGTIGLHRKLYGIRDEVVEIVWDVL